MKLKTRAQGNMDKRLADGATVGLSMFIPLTGGQPFKDGWDKMVDSPISGGAR